MSMAADEFEALDLACRHDVDVAVVLDLPAEEAAALLAGARQSLERALGAEILVSRGHACPDLAEVLADWAGTMTPWRQERVLEHAAGCQACGTRLPRNVSAARVFALLPAPVLSPLARAEVLGFFDEQRLAAYREFAVSRTAALAEWGFPVIAGPPDPAPALEALAEATQAARSRRHRPGALIAAVGAIALAAVVASTLVLVGSSGRAAAIREIMPTAAARRPAAAVQAQPSGLGTAGAIGSPGRAGRGRTQEVLGSRLATALPPAGPPGGRGQVMIADATAPRAAKAPATQKNAPAAAVQGPGRAPASPGTLQVSTTGVALGTGSVGQLTLAAAGGTVSWSASSSDPGEVSLSSYSGTLQAGQSVTLTVTVSRGADPGSAVISLVPPASAPQTVLLSWTAWPSGPGSSGHRWHRRPDGSDGSDGPGPAAEPSAESLSGPERATSP